MLRSLLESYRKTTVNITDRAAQISGDSIVCLQLPIPQVTPRLIKAPPPQSPLVQCRVQLQ